MHKSSDVCKCELCVHIYVMQRKLWFLFYFMCSCLSINVGSRLVKVWFLCFRLLQYFRLYTSLVYLPEKKWFNDSVHALAFFSCVPPRSIIWLNFRGLGPDLKILVIKLDLDTTCMRFSSGQSCLLFASIQHASLVGTSLLTLLRDEQEQHFVIMPQRNGR